MDTVSLLREKGTGWVDAIAVTVDRVGKNRFTPEDCRDEAVRIVRVLAAASRVIARPEEE